MFNPIFEIKHFRFCFSIAACPPNFVKRHGGEKCYRQWGSHFDFVSAIKLCSEFNATLAAPVTAQENADILHVMKTVQAYIIAVYHDPIVAPQVERGSSNI